MTIPGYVMISLIHSRSSSVSTTCTRWLLWPETQQSTGSLYTDIQTPQTRLGLTLYLWSKGKVHRFQWTSSLH